MKKNRAEGRRAAGLLLALAFLLPQAGRGQASLTVNRLIHVAATGTPAQNCQAAKDVINGITGASATTPYLVKLEPGVYDCGFTMLRMRQHISVEGSGKATIIRGASYTVLELASNMELRSVRVENTNAACEEPLHAVGAFFEAVTNTRLYDVVSESLCVLGYGYLGQAPPPGVVDVTIDHSELKGGGGAIRLINSIDAIRCRFSVLDGAIDANLGASLACVQCSDAGNNLLDANCLP